MTAQDRPAPGAPISAVLPGLPGYWAHLDDRARSGSWARPVVGWAVLVDGSVTPLLQEPDGRVTAFSQLVEGGDVTGHVHDVVLGNECPGATPPDAASVAERGAGGHGWCLAAG